MSKGIFFLITCQVVTNLNAFLWVRLGSQLSLLYPVIYWNLQSM